MKNFILLMFMLLNCTPVSTCIVKKTYFAIDAWGKSNEMHESDSALLEIQLDPSCVYKSDELAKRQIDSIAQSNDLSITDIVPLGSKIYHEKRYKIYYTRK